MPAIDPGASSITVAVRVRPFTIREAAQLQRHNDGTVFLGDGSLAGAPAPKLKQSGIRSVIKVIDDRCLIFDPPEDNPIHKFSRSLVPNGKKVKDQTFGFDRIFDDNTTQTEVYEATTKGLLDSVLDGYNATVFAYGATGCGKTHTITGTPQMPGIIFLTMQELFEKIGDCSDEKHTEISLSYLEIYNETIRDLLVPGGSKQGLMLREDSNQAVTVQGLTSHHPKNVQEVMDMIVLGNEYRTVSPTDANATSSRSHAVLQINIAMKDRNAAVNEPHTMATLSIIDLAGSERASATKNRGERLIEGANINKSLLALGSCINALCDPAKNSHVPYRNSKLTRLLKFSLGGNCKTVMIVCVSPSSVHYDETQNTLRYANRAKNIQTKVTRNVFNVNRHVKDFLVKIDEQMSLINELKAQQKDAEKIFFTKFRKQMEKKDALVREGAQRIRTAYENSLPERQEKVAHMKKLRGIERRISLLTSWIEAFDTVCDTRKEEDAMPAPLSAMRKTANGILIELEHSRHHLHQKLEKTNWERAIDGALHHSINQLRTSDVHTDTDTGEIASLTREAELLKSDFTREAYREVLDQDKAGDAVTVQALLTAQFEILTSLSETVEMNEEEAVAHAKDIIQRLLETGFAATSRVVKPDGAGISLEPFSPTKRGTPRRKRTSALPRDLMKSIPAPPALTAVAESEPMQVFFSPVKGTPRRRKATNPRKSIGFSPAKKRTPSKRSVRWRDDDEDGTLADFEKTPKNLTSTPQEPTPAKFVSRIPDILSPVKEADPDEESSPSLLVPEVTKLSISKPSRFQAGFLSKSRQSLGGDSPEAPTMSLSLAPSSAEGRASPLRTLDPSRATNSSIPMRRYASLSPRASPKAFPSSLPMPSPSTGDENQVPSSDSETSALIDSSKLRSALHASKRPKRLSLMTDARRVSSIGSIGSHHRPSAAYTAPSLSSSGNGVSRLRRQSTERRRSPPISCSPPDRDAASKTSSLTAGQARRMNMGGGALRATGCGSPGGAEKRSNSTEPAPPRRITIGGATMMGFGGGAKKDKGGGLIWR